MRSRHVGDELMERLAKIGQQIKCCGRPMQLTKGTEGGPLPQKDWFYNCLICTHKEPYLTK